MSSAPIAVVRYRTFAAGCIAFLLPLGFLGVAAVVLAAVYALIHVRSLGNLSWRPVLWTAPFAAVHLGSSVLSVGAGGEVGAAIGLATLLTVGLQTLRVLASTAGAGLMHVSFVAGSLVFAASICVDALAGRNALPSGLFFAAELHNWAGAILALAFPLALALARRPDRRLQLFGLATALTILAGSALTLSWVGLLGLLVGTFALGATPIRAAILALVTVTICAATIFTPLPWAAGIQRAIRSVDLRGYSLDSLEYVLKERLVIYREGLYRASLKPWFGWGVSTDPSSAAAYAGSEVTWIGSRGTGVGTNLLISSEQMDNYPWRAAHALRVSDAAIAPDGSQSADLVVGLGVVGQRIQQRVDVTDVAGAVYTLSAWVRTEQGPNSIGLSLRDPMGSTDTISSLTAGPDSTVGNEVVGNGAARFAVDEAWRRIWITTSFDTVPSRGALAVIHLDGYHLPPGKDDRFYIWGVQVNPGASQLEYEPSGVRLITSDLVRLPHFHSLFVETLYQSGIAGVFSLTVLVVGLLMLGPRQSLTPVRASLLAFFATQAFDYAIPQSNILLSVMLVAAIGMPAAPADASAHQYRPRAGTQR